MSFTSAVRRDLSLVVVAKTVSLLGDEVAALTLTLELQARGDGTVPIAALLMAALVPLVVLAPLVGRLVDTLDSRRVLVTSSLVQAALCAVLAFQTSTPLILLLVAALGAGQAVNGATWQALLPGIVGTDALPRAMGLNQAAMTIASVISPALAGVLFGQFGARVPLLLDAGTFLAITVAGLFVATRHGGRAAGAAARQGGGLGILRRDPLLSRLLLLLAVFVALGSMVNVVEVFLVRGTLRASATWYGVTGAAFAVGMLGGALLGGRLRGEVPLARALVGGAAGLALALVGIAAVPNVYWLLPLTAAVGVGNGMLNVALSSIVMGRAATDVRGRVAAALSGVASAAQLGAFAAGGALGTVLTPREIFVLGGVLGLLAPLVLGGGLLRRAAQTAPVAAATPAAAPVAAAAGCVAP